MWRSRCRSLDNSKSLLAACYVSPLQVASKTPLSFHSQNVGKCSLIGIIVGQSNLRSLGVSQSTLPHRKSLLPLTRDLGADSFCASFRGSSLMSSPFRGPSALHCLKSDVSERHPRDRPIEVQTRVPLLPAARPGRKKRNFQVRETDTYGGRL